MFLWNRFVSEGFVRRTLARTRGTFSGNRIPINTIVMESNRVVTTTRGLHRRGRGTLSRTRVRTVGVTYRGLGS